MSTNKQDKQDSPFGQNNPFDFSAWQIRQYIQSKDDPKKMIPMDSFVIAQTAEEVMAMASKPGDYPIEGIQRVCHLTGGINNKYVILDMDGLHRINKELEMAKAEVQWYRNKAKGKKMPKARFDYERA